MTSALLAVSAVIDAPFAENDTAPADCRAGQCGGRRGRRACHRPGAGKGRRLRRRRRTTGLRRAAVAARQHRPQRLRHARGLGILQVDDEHVAAGPARRVEIVDQLPDAREAAGIVGAHEDAVRPRIGDYGDPLLRITGPGPRGPRCSAVRDQSVQQHDEVHCRRVAHRHHDRFATRRLVQRRDDPVDPLQIVGIVGDDERVAARVGSDRVVRRDQRPQHVDELLGRFVPELDDLRHQPIAAAGERPLGDGTALLLGVDFRDDLHDSVAFDGREPQQPQRRKQRRVDEAPGDGLGRHDVDRALHPRIDHEVAAGDLGDRPDDGFDVGVDEVERHRLLGRMGERGECGGQRQPEHPERPRTAEDNAREGR